MSRLLLLLALPIALAAAPTARAGDSDPAVKAALDSQKVKYEVDDDGDFKIEFDLGGGRSQIVWIRSKTETYGSLKVREIWSPGYKSESNDFPALIANTLLDKNHEVKLGAWEAQDTMAMFVVKVAADANADQLVDAIEAAVNSADEVEKEITGAKDEY